MSIRVRCATCHRELRVAGSAVGMQVKCPLCQAVFTARPAATATTAAPPPARQGLPPLPEPAPPPPPSPAREEGSRAPEPRPTGAEPPPAEDEPLEVVPIRRAGPRPFPPLHFPVAVQADPGKSLKGRLEAELSAAGLSLRQQEHDMLLPVGTAARYLGRNRIAVSLAGREVTLAVVPPRSYQHRLARDVVAFLRGERSSLRAGDYTLPLALYLPVLVPLGIPLLAISWRLAAGGPSWFPDSAALWGALWGTVGGGLAGLCFALTQRERWPAAVRVVGSLGLAGVGYAGLLVALVVGAREVPGIDPAAWQEFSPPQGGFRVLMPGTPAERQQAQPGFEAGLTAWSVELKRPQAEFWVGYGDIPMGDFFRVPPEQRFDSAAEGMKANTPGSEILSQRPLRLGDSPGREVVLDAGRSDKVVAHMYLVQNHFFLLAAGGPRLGPDSADVQKFLQSFQLGSTPRTDVPPPGVPPPATEFPGLLGYWPFDEGEGTKARDASGGGNDAVLTGDARWVQGVRGSALGLPGANFGANLPATCEYGKSPRFNFKAGLPFTLCGWVRTQTLNGAIVYQTVKEPIGGMIGVSVGGGKLQAKVVADPEWAAKAARAEAMAFLVGDVVNDGTWHHFALMRHPDGAVELFQDGRSQGRVVAAGAAGPIITDLRRVGRGGAEDTLAGAVDELALFGRALGSVEVRRLAGRP